MQLQCFPLQAVMAALNNPIVGYLSLDINGSEYTILKTMNWTNLKISAMSVEMSNNKEDIYNLLGQKSYSYVKSAGFSDIFLSKKGQTKPKKK